MTIKVLLGDVTDQRNLPFGKAGDAELRNTNTYSHRLDPMHMSSLA